MAQPTSLHQPHDLPNQVHKLIEQAAQGDWRPLADALDNGLPSNLESNDDVPLLEYLLFAIDERAKSEGLELIPQAPIELLEAFIRNGLDKQGCYDGQSTHFSICTHYAQWQWAVHLAKAGFPVEHPSHSALVVMSTGRAWRAIDRALHEPADPQDNIMPGNLARLPALPSDDMPTGRCLVMEHGDDPDTLFSIINELVAQGASLEAASRVDHPTIESKGIFTPLLSAIHYGDEALVDALVRAGARLDHRAEGCPYRPLELAIARRSQHIARMLVSHGAPVGCDPSHEGAARKLSHPLLLCAREGLHELVPVLIGAMTEEDRQAHAGLAMHVAAAGGHVQVMQALHDHGIGYDYPTQANGFKPLHQAALHGQVEVMSFLIEQGQSWEQANNAGLTARNLLAAEHPHLLQQFDLGPAGNVTTLFGPRKRR